MLKCRVAFALALMVACGNPSPDAKATGEVPARATPVDVFEGEPAKPPFLVQGEGEGLLLVWYDADGAPHPAQKRSDIPESQRSHVRVDSLDVPPEKRLDPAFMYVADMRAPGPDGSYPVRKVKREAFEQAVAKVVTSSTDNRASVGADEVIIYKASWCGVCKAAARYLRGKGVPFVEKDIEKEPGAREEMLAKARAQGVNASGVPVLDIKGKLLAGFDPATVDRMLAAP